jgi:hypothetical protein
MKHHHHLETQHGIAARLMSKEAEKITALIASLRQSVLDIDKERARAADASALNRRRINLMLTIAALEDRLSAMHGLLELDRPHTVHWKH